MRERRIFHRVTALAFLVGSLLIAWGLIELSLLLLLSHPSLLLHLPMGMKRNLRELYSDLDRPIIQFDPERAQFDSRLLYTLRPGRFEYRAREFTTHYDVNRIGVRDDDQSLQQPQIVVLGDSYAMGWGVEQNETFPQLLEQMTGRWVLNAGVSSYGTVREMRMLERIDLSRTTDIIIQYCSNDADENEAFANGKEQESHLPVEFQDIVHWSHDLRGYWFGRYAWWVLRQSFRREAHAQAGMSLERQVDVFLTALERAARKPLPDGVHLITFYANQELGFLDALESMLKTRADLPAVVRSMKVVRLPAPPPGFILDEHWTAAGHRQVAEVLLPALSGR